MRLEEAIIAHPSVRIFRVANSESEQKSEWDVQSVDAVGALLVSDEQIKLLVKRGAVIGTARDAWMLYPGWKRGETSTELVSLQSTADHIDHVCHLAGSAAHSALSTDLDGGFGTQQTPRGLDTYADVNVLEDLLARHGYSGSDVDATFYGNWYRFFSQALPA
jgi:membrane dipeptidase